MLGLTGPLGAPARAPWREGRPLRAANKPPPLSPRVAVVAARRRANPGVIPPLLLPPRGSRPAPVTTARATAAAAADGNGGLADDSTAPATTTTTTQKPSVAPTVAAVLASGVLNRVLYRMALVPMAAHTFALAQFQNAAYVGIYGALVLLRRARGKLPAAHLTAVPVARFAVPGACEAAAQLLLMRSAAQLPGAMLPLLAQTTLAWSLFWRAVVLRVAPTRPQAGGVALVAAGVALASLPASAASASSSASSAAAVLTASPANVALCVLSFAFPALATILKEAIFRDAAVALSSGGSRGGSGSSSTARRRKDDHKNSHHHNHHNLPHHQKEQLDVLVVNLATSAFQAAFVLALLPLAAASRGVPLSDVPALLAAGAKQLWAGSPGLLALVPLAYVAVNIAFNVLSLGLVRAVGAVPTALTASAMVPLTVAAFALPLPLLAPASLGAGFWPGAALTVAGLAVYNGAAEPGALRSWLAARERAAEAASWCAERRSWQQAAALAGAEAEAAAAASAAAAARLAELKCDDAEVAASVAAVVAGGSAKEGGDGGNHHHSSSSSSSSSNGNGTARVVVLPAPPLPPSHHLGVVPSASSSSSEEEQEQQQQEQQQRRRAVPSPS